MNPIPHPSSLIPHPSFSSHKAFTLVELIVVVGIIAVLMGVLIVNVSGGTESARSARCLSNMKNLASACQTYGAEHRRYPLAGSIEYMKVVESDNSTATARYNEIPGWISWNSKGVYANKPSSPQGKTSWMVSMYSTDNETKTYCLTNSALWRYVSGNRQTYVCPSHAKKTPNKPPIWSYLMNAYFGWYGDEEPQAENYQSIEYGHLEKADKVLLFSEVPFAGVGTWQPDANSTGTDGDCVLQFDTSVKTDTGSLGMSPTTGGTAENIGFNHKNGKMTFAHVVFADGHVEKLQLPKGGMSDTQLKELTAWLCKGVDISFNGRIYDKMDR